MANITDTIVVHPAQDSLGPESYIVGMVDFTNILVGEPLVTETTEDSGKLNVFVIQPLGLELIREYWI